jgi:hypothetical protein
MKMRRLDGWQRLWVIAMAFWAAFVGAVLITEYPTSPALACGRFPGVAAHRVESVVGNSLLVAGAKPARRHDGTLSTESIFGYSLPEAGASMRFCDFVAQELDRNGAADRLAKESIEANVLITLLALAAWLGGGAFAYGCGAAVGWVVRGFKRPEE